MKQLNHRQNIFLHYTVLFRLYPGNCDLQIKYTSTVHEFVAGIKASSWFLHNRDNMSEEEMNQIADNFEKKYVLKFAHIAENRKHIGICIATFLIP